MYPRLLRIAALAGLTAVAACQQDPLAHTDFTVSPNTTGAAGSTSSTPDASPITDATTSTDGMTTGCGMAPNQSLGMYVEYHLSVGGPDLDAASQPKVRDRIYYVRLPLNYDPSTPYRVVYLGTGCGGTTSDAVIRLNQASNEQAILVAPMPLQEFGQCFDETTNSVEYPFFDALHKLIENTYCVDTTRQFYAGFSTGAWFGNMLGCVFPDVLRAYATIQGGLPPLPACKDHPIANFTFADTQETGNPYQSNVMAAERVLAANKCKDVSPPDTPAPVTAVYDTGPLTALPPTAKCVKYTGCPAAYPVVFCTTMGQGHQQFETNYCPTCKPFSDQAFWNFFSAF